MYINNRNRNKEYFNWNMLLFVSLSSAAMGIYRDGFSSLFPFLQSEFDLTRAQVSLYSTLLYLTSTFFSLISGRLVDIKGTKSSMIFGMLFVGILLIFHSIAPTFYALLILAAITGIGMSINPSATNKGITEWFLPRLRNTATGIWSTSYPIGGAMAASVLPIVGTLIGWRNSVIISGSLILLCILPIFFFYSNKNSNKKEKKTDFHENKRKAISFKVGFSELIKNNNLLAVSVFGFFLGATEGAILTHFTLFLYLDYGLSKGMAGLGFAFCQFGSIFGRLFWGTVCDKFLNANRRKAFLILGSIFFLITIIFGLFLKTINPSIAILYFLAFLAGCSARGWDGLFFPSVTEIVKEEQVGMSVGFSLLFIRTGILLSPPIFGYIADIRGNYDFSWLLLGLMMFLTSFVQYIFFIKKSRKN